MAVSPFGGAGYKAPGVSLGLSSTGQFGAAKPKPKEKIPSFNTPPKKKNPGDIYDMRPGPGKVPGKNDKLPSFDLPKKPKNPRDIIYNSLPGPGDVPDRLEDDSSEWYGGPKKPKQISWEDSEWQATERSLKKALADYMARRQTESTRTATDYNQAQRDMGTQKVRDLDDIREDFASRGVLQSGVYGTRVGEYNTDFGNKTAELSRRYNDQVKDFSDSLREFQEEQNQAREAAKLAAIRRRAAKLGAVK